MRLLACVSCITEPYVAMRSLACVSCITAVSSPRAETRSRSRLPGISSCPSSDWFTPWVYPLVPPPIGPRP
eukprot:344418-Pyramimonas_sp.AAC.1